MARPKKVPIADTQYRPPTVRFDDLPDDALVAVKTVAVLHDCSVPTIWRWAREGLIPAPVRVGKRSARWRVGSLRASTRAAA